MTLDDWLHLAHVLCAIVWLGGGSMLAVIGLRARSSDDPHALGQFAAVLPYTGTRVLAPAVAGTVLTGSLLVAEDAAWNLGQTWVRLALGLFVVAFLIGAVYLSRVAIRLQRATQKRDQQNQARALLSRWLAGYGLVLVVLIIVVWDMIVKPGL